MTDQRSTLTSVGPENNIIFIRIVPTLKEVEKQMSSFDIDIPSERSVGNMFKRVVISEHFKAQLHKSSLDSCIAE